MTRGELAAGGDEGRGGGEDDLRAVLGGLLHDGVHVAVGFEVVAADGDLAAHGRLEGAAAEVVTGYPVAVDGVRAVYEGDVQVVREEDGAEDAVEDAFGGGLLGVVGADFDGLALGLGLKV